MLDGPKSEVLNDGYAELEVVPGSRANHSFMEQMFQMTLLYILATIFVFQ